MEYVIVNSFPMESKVEKFIQRVTCIGWSLIYLPVVLQTQSETRAQNQDPLS